MTDIVERLQRLEPVYNGCAVPCGQEPVNPDGPEAADTIASLRKQLEDAREALRQWQEWETKWLVDARSWVIDDGSYIPQDLFDEYICGPQSAREALKGKS